AVDVAVNATSEAFQHPAVTGFFQLRRNAGAAPVPVAVMRHGILGTVHGVGFFADQVPDNRAGHNPGSGASADIARVDIALTAGACLELQGLVIGNGPAQYAIDVLIAYSLAPCGVGQSTSIGHTRGVRYVDIGIIRIGLVQVAVYTEGQRVGQWPAQAEVGALGHALGIVFRNIGIGG